MSTDVKFEDFSLQVEGALNDAAIAYLHEAGGAIVTQTVRNSRRKSGNTAGSFRNVVDVGNYEATVGSPMENAIWEEFGTGEYAVHGDGRKGGWWVPVGGGGISPADAQRFGKKKRDKNGNIVAVFTTGKTPTRAFQSAFDSLRSALIKRAEDVFKQKMK